jgi:predicted 2-oxoglutarate/Fe(II)-dependent dioxygenase YbiX
MALDVEPEVLASDARSCVAPLVVAGFLDIDTCRRVRRAMDAGTPEAAEILDSDSQLDERVRRATLIEVDKSTLRALERELDAARASVADHFRVPLRGREGLSIVRYPPGGFFKPHRDRGRVASWPAASLRRTAVVVFLNSSHDFESGGDFGGGVLRLLDDTGEGWLDITPMAGTLVAFPATMLHEVTVVEGGTRDTLVDWFS